ncbi:MAG: DUF6350 family protein [Actinomycetaceae bacterium]|nr:DUF6350 family protein [Actinomycetaceae bacterium]
MPQDTSPAKNRPEVVVRLPQGWSLALVKGAIIACLPWLIIEALGAVVALQASGNPWLASVSVADQVSQLSHLWALIYGVPLTLSALTGAVTITLIPWGASLVCAWLLSRRARRMTGWLLVYLWLGYVLTCLAIATTAVGIAYARLLLGAGVLAALGIGWGRLATALGGAQSPQAGDREHTRLSRWGVEASVARDRVSRSAGIDEGAWRLALGSRTKQVPGFVGIGIIMGWHAVAFTGAIALFLAAVGLLVNLSQITGIADLLPLGPTGWVALILLQLAYAPTFAAWAFAWLLGPGYTLGEGTHFSIFGFSEGPIPAIPVLAGAPDITIGWWALVPVLLTSALGGAWVACHRARYRFGEHAGQLVVALAVMIACYACVFALSSGGLGTHRLAHVGVDMWMCVGVVCLAWLLPGSLVYLFMHPSAREFVSSLLASASFGARGRGNDRSPSSPKEERSGGEHDAGTEQFSTVPSRSSEGESDGQEARGGEEEPEVDERGRRIARIVAVDAAAPSKRRRPQVGTAAPAADTTETSPIDCAREDS